MAGCGLGSMLITDNSMVMQLFAGTSNAFFGSQTFGITFGTSNCTETGGGSDSAEAFVQTNRETVAKEISRGSGETIATLATLGGCPNAVAVGASLQRSFSSIFPQNAISDVRVSHNVIDAMRADSSLACAKLN